MKRWLLPVLALLGGGGWWFLKKEATQGGGQDVPANSVKPNEPPFPLEYPGDLLLKNYASEGTSPIEDMKKIGRVIENFFLLHKTIDSFHASTKEDFALLLRGENPDRVPFISKSHPIYSAEGFLIDRWRTPLFFHSVAQRKIEIRSAGPDQKMFTADDLVHDPTGLIKVGL